MAKHLASKDHRMNALKYKSHIWPRMIYKSFVVYITASLLYGWCGSGREEKLKTLSEEEKIPKPPE